MTCRKALLTCALAAAALSAQAGEPQTWAMLLAGALVLARASRAHSTKEST